MSRSDFIIQSVLVLTISGCAVNTAPEGFLRDGYSSQKTSNGGWIEVSYNNETGETDYIEGEFIAYDHDSVYVMTEIGKLRIIPVPNILKAKLTGYDAKTRYLGGWVFCGLLATPTQGMFAIITIPGWLLFGVASTAAYSYSAQMKYPNKSFDEFRGFSRFPQGFPDDYISNSIPLKPESLWMR